MRGLVTGSWSTNLWLRSEVDVRLLTELWVTIAGETGALFGRAEDEWSLEQIWSELSDSRSGTFSPALESFPEWLSWWTYLDADGYRR
ncbi:hypothetical protein [Amycolatopsis speibonae]|uniref:Uncharacterized protein n=1 Tax=Amycolatopsis speibonae TaxID=1450224 RepID=A0ABV7PA54_9PSEU